MKNRGRGVQLLLTRHATKHVYPERPPGVKDLASIPLIIEAKFTEIYSLYYQWLTECNFRKCFLCIFMQIGGGCTSLCGYSVFARGDHNIL